MSNTISSTLIPEILNDSKVCTVLNTRVARLLDTVSLQIAVDPVAPKANINVPCVTGGPTVQTNATDFESGNSTVVPITVAANQLTASFHITNAEANNGYQLRWLMRKAMANLSIKLVDTILAPVTTTNFGTAALDSTAANFDGTDMPTIWAAGNGANFPMHHLLLSGTWYAKLLPTSLTAFSPDSDGAYGFDSILCHNRWDGAGSGVIGFHHDDNALAVGLGVPAMNSEIATDMIESQNVLLEDIGITVQYNRWVARQGRTMWASLDIMCGAAVADGTAGEVITNGAS